MGLATFLSDASTSQLRGLAWVALTDQGRVGSATITSDGGGGGTAVWAYGGTVACCIDPLSTGRDPEQLVADRISDRSTHRVHAEPATEVSLESRFWILGRGTYEVTAVDARTGQDLTVFEVVELS